MSLNCIITIKNGHSRAVLEPSFQVVFRNVSQNAIFYFFEPKFGKTGSKTTHNADIFKNFEHMYLNFKTLKKVKFYQICVDPVPQVLRFSKLSLIINIGKSLWLQQRNESFILNSECHQVQKLKAIILK